jgi:hypothetical protein
VFVPRIHINDITKPLAIVSAGLGRSDGTEVFTERSDGAISQDLPVREHFGSRHAGRKVSPDRTSLEASDLQAGPGNLCLGS